MYLPINPSYTSALYRPENDESSKPVNTPSLAMLFDQGDRVHVFPDIAQPFGHRGRYLRMVVLAKGTDGQPDTLRFYLSGGRFHADTVTTVRKLGDFMYFTDEYLGRDGQPVDVPSASVVVFNGFVDRWHSYNRQGLSQRAVHFVSSVEDLAASYVSLGSPVQSA